MKIIYNKSTGIVFDALQDIEVIVRDGDQLQIGTPATKIYTQSSDLEVAENVTVPEGWSSGKYCYQPDSGTFVQNMAWGEPYYLELQNIKTKYEKLVTLLMNKNSISQEEFAKIEGLPETNP